MEGNKVWAYGKDSQKHIRNAYSYVVEKKGMLYGAVTEVSKTLKINYKTVLKIVAMECPTVPGKSGSKRVKFADIDDMTKDLVRRIVYNFFDEKQVPTLKMIYGRLIERTKGTEHPFSYKISNCGYLLKKLGFKYCKVNRRACIMECPRLVAWLYEYLTSIKRFRDEGRPIIYLDETWFDSHVIPDKGWSDSSNKCVVDSVARGANGFVPGCALVAGKSLKKCHADYHKDMKGTVFEEWFQSTLIPNLQPNTVIVLDNAKYHSRQSELIPSTNTNKPVMLVYMEKHGIPIPSPVPIKMKLLEIIRLNNIKKQYVIDELAKKSGHEVLRLPPYHCVFNPIEMVWHELKSNVRRENVHTKDTDEVMNLIRKTFDKIDSSHWNKYIEINKLCESGKRS